MDDSTYSISPRHNGDHWYRVTLRLGSVRSSGDKHHFSYAIVRVVPPFNSYDSQAPT